MCVVMGCGESDSADRSYVILCTAGADAWMDPALSAAAAAAPPTGTASSGNAPNGERSWNGSGGGDTE